MKINIWAFTITEFLRNENQFFGLYYINRVDGQTPDDSLFMLVTVIHIKHTHTYNIYILRTMGINIFPKAIFRGISSMGRVRSAIAFSYP